ncbi:hypothetical protein [uncultured Aquimarina sp.]|uniref:hypothetical protein n=1 Tax=uncultured Aquimarina sp. TaxID=575652 RepID=UPI0026182F45|nr:hypothetical protein [uncultured Aquimarina sp.]
MKNKRKLSLDKIKIAKLNNTRAILGGSLVATENLPVINAMSIIEQCTDSTKTGAISFNTDD